MKVSLRDCGSYWRSMHRSRRSNDTFERSTRSEYRRRRFCPWTIKTSCSGQLLVKSRRSGTGWSASITTGASPGSLVTVTGCAITSSLTAHGMGCGMNITTGGNTGVARDNQLRLRLFAVDKLEELLEALVGEAQAICG